MVPYFLGDFKTGEFFSILRFAHMCLDVLGWRKFGCFLILRLGAPTGSSEEVLQTLRPFESPDVFGGAHPVIRCRFLSFGIQSLSPDMRGSLWPSCAGHGCLDWSDSESSQWLLRVAYYLLCTCKLRLSEALFGLFMSKASTPVAFSGHESSRWLLHTVYLIYANWAL